MLFIFIFVFYIFRICLVINALVHDYQRNEVAVQAIVIFAIPWSIAAMVDVDGRQKFDQFYRQLLLGQLQEFPVPHCLVGKLDLPPAGDGLIYDFCLEVRV